MRKGTLTKAMQILGKRMRQMYSQNQKGIRDFAKENRNAMEAA